MLVVRGREISDRQVLDLPDLLRPGDVLVFNDTKVIPAQLEGRRGDASIGATLHKRDGPRSGGRSCAMPNACAPATQSTSAKA